MSFLDKGVFQSKGTLFLICGGVRAACKNFNQGIDADFQPWIAIILVKKITYRTKFDPKIMGLKPLPLGSPVIQLLLSRDGLSRKKLAEYKEIGESIWIQFRAFQTLPQKRESPRLQAGECQLLEWVYVNHKKLNKISTIAEPLNLQGDSRYLRQNSSPTNVIRG